jgi:photosystem II stability/assembly factor-like uncharacterized protein
MDKINPTPVTPNKEIKSRIPAFGRKAWIMFLGLLLVLALVSTFAAFFQPPHRDPSQKASFPGLNWLLRPIEQNAELRLPAISSHLNDVFVLPGTSHVWAVGDTGMILHSPDAGISWKRVPEEQPRKAAGYIHGSEQAFSIGNIDIRIPDLMRKAYAADAPKKTIPNIRTSTRDPAAQNQPPAPKQFTVGPNTNIRQSAQPSIQQQPPVDQNRQAAAEQIFVEPYYSQRPVDFYAVKFVDENRGWAVGSEGAIVFTQDGGERWAIIELIYKAPLYALQILADGNRGWAAGEGGVLLDYLDPKPIWMEIEAPDRIPRNDLYAMWVTPDGREGWAVGGGGVILRFQDGSWQPDRRALSLPELFLSDLWMNEDGSEGWAVGAAGSIVRYRGGRWQFDPDAGKPTEADLYSVWFQPDGAQGLIVGEGGTILRTTDAGQSWQAIDSGTEEDLSAVCFFPEGRRGWAVGKRGTILFSDNGGGLWIKQSRPFSMDLLDDTAAKLEYRRYPAPWYYLFLLVLMSLFVWTLSRQPRKKPAQTTPQDPYIEKKGFDMPTADRAISVADEMVSDRPLGLDDPDPLDFKTIARGLSRFLRNKNTRPPLTIAVTGEWGSGKSTLMNMLREDLMKWGFRPIWFNAWHHQTEEHFLASLLESIRKQAVPRLLTLRGLRFRFRLLWFRSHWYWLSIMALALLTAFGIGYLKHDRESRTTLLFYGLSLVSPKGDVPQDFKKDSPVAITEWMISKLEENRVRPRVIEAIHILHEEKQGQENKFFKNDFVLLAAVEETGSLMLTAREKRLIRKLADEEFGEPKFKWDTFFATLMGGGGLGGFILLLLKGMTAFGAAPASVITSLSGRMSIRRLRAAVGLRQRFAAEFELVTRALHPHTLLLVVDDLDRCKPESVLNTLETVNFLASSGDCFIVLGMDPAWVVSCVGERFKDVAAQILEEREAEIYESDHLNDAASLAGGEDTIVDDSELSEDGTRRVAVFARRYLEKLVNVEVPVPVPESGQTRKLLTQGRQDSKDHSPAALVMKGVQFAVRRFGTLVLIAGMLIGGYLVGHNLGEDKMKLAKDQTRIVQETRQKALEKVNREGKQPDGSGEKSGAIKRESAKDSGHFVSPGITGSLYALRDLSWPMIALIAFIFVIALFGLFQLPPDPELEDSQEFANALKTWHPWVVIKRQTPRSVKRYKNRVRYFAMRLRSDDEPQPAWKRLLQRWKKTSADKEADEELRPDEVPLQEPLLVALGAIHHCNNHWIEDDELFKLVKEMKIGELFDKSAVDGMHKPSEAQIQKLVDAMNQHTADFDGLWPPKEEQRRKFISLSKGIRTF